MTRAIIAAVLTVSALPTLAADRTYVVCDNGLRCVTAPCPSTTALDVRRKTVERGIWVDTAGLPPSDREIAQTTDILYDGSRVVTARREDRSITVMGRDRTLPFLIATKLGRSSTATERRLCRRR